VWDIYYRMSGPVYLHKVSDASLSCISVQGSAQGGGGRLVAVGDVSGSVTQLEVSENLAASQPNEKLLIGAFFERESKREETLEKRAIALARAAKAAKSVPGGAELGSPMAAPVVDEVDAAVADTLKRIDGEFTVMLEGGGDLHNNESKAEAKEEASEQR
jgi:dynein intermediate chain 2